MYQFRLEHAIEKISILFDKPLFVSYAPNSRGFSAFLHTFNYHCRFPVAG